MRKLANVWRITEHGQYTLAPDETQADALDRSYSCDNTIYTRFAYHSNIKGLGHHGNEHVEEEDSGRNIVKAEQKLSEAFDIAQFNFEDD